MNYRLMQHERMRWESMTDKQLIARLGKITTMEKLECFIRLCHEYPDRSYLLGHAEERKRQLAGGIPGNWGKPKVGGTTIQKAKESFYEKVSGQKWSQPKSVVKAMTEDPVAKKIVDEWEQELRKEGKQKLKKISDEERYLDF